MSPMLVYWQMHVRAHGHIKLGGLEAESHSICCVLSLKMPSMSIGLVGRATDGSFACKTIKQIHLALP